MVEIEKLEEKKITKIIDIQKDKEITVGDFIDSIKEHRDKELMTHVHIAGKKGNTSKYLVGFPEIYAGIDYNENMLDLTILFGEWELENDDNNNKDLTDDHKPEYTSKELEEMYQDFLKQSIGFDEEGFTLICKECIIQTFEQIINYIKSK